MPNSKNTAKTINKFEYETCYYDEVGEIKLWEDAEGFYYGDAAPKETEDCRWIIAGYEGERKKYHKQIKEK